MPLRGNAGDGSIQNALRDALGILSGKTFQQSKGCCKMSRAKDVENFSKEHLKQPKS